MTEDRGLERIVDAIDTKFGVHDHGRTTRPVEDARDLTEHVAWIMFERAGERYKLERVTGPAIINRRTIGARRAGAEVRYENVYDPGEVSHRTNLYRQTGGEWESISPDELGL